MRMMIIAAAASLALAGCQNTQDVDAAIQKNLPQVCSAASIAHVAFVAVAETGRIRARTVAAEANAWAALEPLCIDPSSATSADVLVAAVTALSTITLALREAERAEAVAESG